MGKADNIKMRDSIHIGPYIKCPIQKIQTTQTMKGCYGCKRSFLDEFCSKCGTTQSEFQIPVINKKVDTWELITEMKEHLYLIGLDNEKFDFYAPNVSTANLKHSFNPIHNASSAKKLANITPNMISSELESFRNDFCKEIATLQETYGEIEILWGYLSYS